MRACLLITVGCTIFTAALSAAEGGNWTKGSTVAVVASNEYENYPEDVWDQPAGRIPPATMRGKTNVRFQWIPGYLDIPIYLIKKYHIVEWLNKHQDQILKYLPTVIRYAAKWNQEKNYVLVTVPAVLKALKKW